MSVLTVLDKIPVNYFLSHSQCSFPSSLNCVLKAVIISHLVPLFSIKLVFLVFPQSSEKTKQKNCVEDRACNTPVKHALNSHIPLSPHICHQLLVLRKTASSHSFFRTFHQTGNIWIFILTYEYHAFHFYMIADLPFRCEEWHVGWICKKTQYSLPADWAD